MKKINMGLAAAMALAAGSAASARWTQLPAGVPVIAQAGVLKITPVAGWNRDSTRLGKHVETWSFDGPLLNRVDVFSNVGAGEPLLKERNRKRDPLPKFAATMLPTDISELFERTQRIMLGTPDFTVDTVAPADFAGRKGFRFTFHYTREADNLTRKGLAAGAIVNGKLQMIVYTAAAVHYYEAGLPGVEKMIASAVI